MNEHEYKEFVAERAPMVEESQYGHMDAAKQLVVSPSHYDSNDEKTVFHMSVVEELGGGERIDPMDVLRHSSRVDTRLISSKRIIDAAWDGLSSDMYQYNRVHSELSKEEIETARKVLQIMAANGERFTEQQVETIDQTDFYAMEFAKYLDEQGVIEYDDDLWGWARGKEADDA